ncbi:phosphate ABC transporter permease [Phormidesmis priestleyi ULC007]|uniref:Phosphate ABC transporter permease n=1 Tax=Phormidesmis priestleyi ULC007 TaxID=1920490 RepID=A0A2T1D8K2_9CYAN|nr:ABC transporter permease subunit [Phormidesmis priestleyi]PSB16838.1 phosphate ABC transporter permease [Phormidesmis priestleyi ULC007]PZO47753.1 MAG: phosphate ABC transporter permease [Phormidesmis priestleyi]
MTVITPALKWGLIGLAAIVLSLLQAGLFRQDLFNLNGVPLLWRFIVASVHPDLSTELLQTTFSATVTTLAYAVCGTFFSVILGMIGGVLASEVWWLSFGQPSRCWLLIRAAIAVPRAIHELIWGLFFVNIWGLDPLTAIVAIAIPFGAITAKVFSEILDETPRTPLLILLNSGVSPLTAFFYSLLPQAFLNLLSYVFYRFECSIRSAAVLGIIGAGGLGYEIFLSLQSLRYEQLWTFFYALFILNGLVDLSSAWLRRRLGCSSRIDLNLQQNKSKTPQKAAQNYFILIPIALFLLTLCFWYINPDFSKFWAPRTQQLFGQFVRSALPPDFSGVPQLIPQAIETVSMSVLAIAFSAFGGLLLAFPAANNFFLPGGLLNQQGNGSLPQIMFLLSRAVLLICRAIPAPIWALVVLFVMFPGILPGAIALGLHNLGILGRLMAEVIENQDQRPLAALKAQGAPNSLIFLYGVLPLTMPRFLAYSLYRWEVCMRETVIVGLVGAGGLGRSLTEQLSSFDYQALIVTLGGFLMLTFLVDWVSANARRSLR